MCSREAARYDGRMTEGTATIGWIGSGAEPLAAETHGEKAAWLSRAAALGLPVPPAFVIPMTLIANLDAACPAIDAALARLEA